jgi:hypothetical protein
VMCRKLSDVAPQAPRMLREVDPEYLVGAERREVLCGIPRPRRGRSPPGRDRLHGPAAYPAVARFGSRRPSRGMSARSAGLRTADRRDSARAYGRTASPRGARSPRATALNTG